MDLTELPEDQRWCVGYEGRYAVTCDGDVYSYIKRGNRYGERLISHVCFSRARNQYMYKMVGLFNTDGKMRKHYLHRLVATSWVDNPENRPQVNHIDHNKLNNNASNLEWVTASSNVKACHDFYGDKLAKIKMQNKGFSDVQDFVKLLIDGEVNGYLSFDVIIEKVPEEVFIFVGVPFAIKSVMRRSDSLLDDWNFIITYLDCIFVDKADLGEMYRKFSLDYSLPSHIRAGRRWQKEIELYNKYRNDPDYLKNYKPTYNLEKSIK